MNKFYEYRIENQTAITSDPVQLNNGQITGPLPRRACSMSNDGFWYPWQSKSIEPVEDTSRFSNPKAAQDWVSSAIPLDAHGTPFLRISQISSALVNKRELLRKKAGQAEALVKEMSALEEECEKLRQELKEEAAKI